MKLVNVGLALAFVAMFTGCASHKAPKSPAAASAVNADTAISGKIIERLLKAEAEYEAARATGDSAAMTRAALARFDAPGKLAPQRIEVGLFERTRIMLLQARIVAGDNTQAQAEIDRLIEETDLGHDTEMAAAGNMADPDSSIFGDALLGVPGSAIGEQFRTYTLEAGGAKTLNLQVTASKGAIVYVETLQSSGIILTVRTDKKDASNNTEETVLCRDPKSQSTTPHGILICRWRPKRDGVVKIILENPGLVEEPVLMITNQ